MKYYYYLTQNGVYNQDGLQYPKDIPFSVEEILLGWEFRWEPYLGWGHQPRYIVVEIEQRDLALLAHGLSKPIVRSTGILFTWKPYWGYDFGGDGAWGSVWEDKSIQRTFVSFPSHRAREIALNAVGAPKPKAYYSYAREPKGGIYLLYPEQFDRLERLVDAKYWSRLRKPFDDLLRCW